MSRRPRRWRPDVDVAEWQGPTVAYDIVKEFVIALVVVGLISVALSALLSSPDKAPMTLRSWARARPVDFAQTATAELVGTSPTATYGPPYTDTSGAGQSIGPVSLSRLVGVHHPINTALDFVIQPLQTLPGHPALTADLATYRSATPAKRQAWTTAYGTALDKGSFSGGALRVRPGHYGPVAPMIGALVSMGQSGALDGALLASPQFYGTDYTKPLLFLADGSYFAAQAGAEHLQGAQWGMMNETGNYPGQAWLWLYTMWYQIPPFTQSGNADALIWAIMMVLSVALVCVPFIPGLRSIPRRLGIYRLIWRDHYRALETAPRPQARGMLSRE